MDGGHGRLGFAQNRVISIGNRGLELGPRLQAGGTQQFHRSQFCRRLGRLVAGGASGVRSRTGAGGRINGGVTQKPIDVGVLHTFQKRIGVVLENILDGSVIEIQIFVRQHGWSQMRERDRGRRKNGTRILPSRGATIGLSCFWGAEISTAYRTGMSQKL